MRRPTVPNSSLQHTIHSYGNEIARPQSGVTNLTKCKILTVFDKERLEEQAPTPDIIPLLEQYPGLLFARVLVISTGKEITVPFGDSEDQVFSTYGNSAVIEGKMGTLEFQNSSLSTAKLYLERTWNTSLLNTREVISSFDIGALV